LQRLLELTFAPLGLSPQEQRLLLTIDMAGEPPTAVILSLGLLKEPQSISRMLNRLEARGLITRVRHPLDRRSSLHELTDAGRQTLRLSEQALSQSAVVLRSLLPNEQEPLLGMLIEVKDYFIKLALKSTEAHHRALDELRYQPGPL
jgi:DNA-binding MarR family transcriptional regulator